MKTTVATHFADLPGDYASLCRLHLPRPIHDSAGYDNTVEIAAMFAGFEDQLTPDQVDYFDLLATLIEAYDQKAMIVGKRSPLETLKFLLEEHGLNASDLSRILSAHRTLGAMILRGERTITAEHARVLGHHFGIPAGTFIE